MLRRGSTAEASKSIDKLKGYHGLAQVFTHHHSHSPPNQVTLAICNQPNVAWAPSWLLILQDALERAHAQDVHGATADAAKLYRMGLSVIQEGLDLQVPVPGLGPQHSNVSKWRSELLRWQQLASERQAPALRDQHAHPASPARHDALPKSSSEMGGDPDLQLRQNVHAAMLLCRLRDLESSCSRLPAASASIPAATAERGRPGAQQSRSLASRTQPQPVSAQIRVQPRGSGLTCK